MSVNGPDAQRYWHSAGGGDVPRPFHLRWLLPVVCGQDERRWWITHVGGWLLATVGMFAWVAADHDWRVAAAATALLLGLPGILGPSAVIPIGVDIQATGLALCAAALFEHGQTAPAVILALVAATVRESSPVWLALWVWSPILLVALAAPIVASVVRRPGPDPTGPKGQFIADHPVKTALMFHRGRWRDGWLLVAPWGATLAGLIEPSPQLVVTLIAAHLLLFVATDTVRLVHHAAGPVMAVAAATVIPVGWLLFACVLHVWWFRQPERV